MVGFACIRGPTGRGVPMQSPKGWLAAKQLDDQTDGLWRVGDALYDLKHFKHPGGKFFINMGKGTDITELFESNHPNIEKARSILSKYFVRNVDANILPRNASALTFHKNGFYDTLRKRSWEILKEHGTGPSSEILFFHDFLLLTFLLSCALLVIPWYEDYWLVIGAIGGFLLSSMGTVAHNFYHQKDSWRMYTWDLTPYSSEEWRISHGYSHHMFPNAVNDFELSAFEPYVYWLPEEKSWLYLLTEPVTAQLLFCVAMMMQGLFRWIAVFQMKETLKMEAFLPFCLLAFMCAVRFVCIFTTQEGAFEQLSHISSIGSFWHFCMNSVVYELMVDCFKVALWRQFVLYIITGSIFHNVSLAAGHHHPDMWAEGDKIPDEMDWGLFQLITVADREVIDNNLYLSGITYGNHALHHLFPSVDASKLKLLKGVLRETCKEFIFDVVKDGDGEAEEVTKLFMKNRQITTFGGWWGMLKQALRIHKCDSNAIFCYKKGNAMQADASVSNEVVVEEPRSPITRSRTKKLQNK